MVTHVQHRHFVDEFLANNHEDTPCRRVALRGAIPVRWAWTGCFGLFEDGSIVYYDDEKQEWAPTVRRDEWLVTIRLAGTTHPEYLELLPLRPDDAPDCPSCRGSGRAIAAPSSDALANVLCGTCSALGWTPRNGWGVIVPFTVATRRA